MFAFKLSCFYSKQAKIIQDPLKADEALALAIKYLHMSLPTNDTACFTLKSCYQFNAILKLIQLTDNGEVTANSLPLYELALKSCLAEPSLKLAQWYQSQGHANLDKAIKAYKILAQGEVPQAQYTLAQIYHSEKGYIDQTNARNLYKKALEQGFIDAALPLGEIYEHGQSCSADLTKAFDLYLQAANAGIAEAQYKVGQCYLNGTGTDTSAQKALSWFEQAASQDHPLALLALGKLYEEGQHVASDLNKATTLYERAEKLGNTDAATVLAKLKLSSTNTADTQEILQQLMASGDQETVLKFHLKNLNQALTSNDTSLLNSSLTGIKDLADQGLLCAQVALAQYYGSSKNQDDSIQSQLYYEMAAEQGHVPSYFVLAKVALDSKDHDVAFHWLTKLTEAAKQAVNKLPNGYTEASVSVTENNGFTLKDYTSDDFTHDSTQASLLLAKCFEQGLGTEVNYKRAFELYSKAEQAGLIEARFALSLLLLNGGNGLKADERQAITLLNKMVKRKFAPAQFELGLLYLNGQALKADQKQAFTLIKAAADQKLPEAMAKLSELYTKGVGTAANPKRAQSYLNKAKALGWKG